MMKTELVDAAKLADLRAALVALTDADAAWLDADATTEEACIVAFDLARENVILAACDMFEPLDG